MKLKFEIIFSVLILFWYSWCSDILAKTINFISVQNNTDQAIFTMVFSHFPIYTIFTLPNPDRIVIDLAKVDKVYNKNVFPIYFHKNNLIKCIRVGIPMNYQSIRIVCDLNYISNIKTIIQKRIEKKHCVVLTISKKIIPNSNINIQKFPDFNSQKIYCTNSGNSKLIDHKKNTTATCYNKILNTLINSEKKIFPIVVAIDAGHGGQDPGATSYYGIYEKNITLGIAKKLKRLLDLDSKFQGVMIRNGDYFLSVMARSNLARQKKANVLVSIHADSSINTKVKGASAWIVSNQRMQKETTHWLQKKERYSELLGGLGYVLSNYSKDPYFSRLILNLQFGCAQKVGYDIAIHILNQLKNIGPLHKNIPECSEFGVLRSPDIPSILIETGFISNLQEGNLLSTDKYQEKIAQALYKGLRSYFLLNTQKL